MLSDCTLSSDEFEMEKFSEKSPLVKDDRSGSAVSSASSPKIERERNINTNAIDCDLLTVEDYNRDAIMKANSQDFHEYSVSNRQNSEQKTKKQQRVTVYVILLTFFSAIGGFLFGYDTGVVSGAMLLLRDRFHLSSFEQELIVSVTIGGAFVSALIGGYLSDRFGRKSCTLVASFIFTAGALILGVAQNVAMLIAGRLTLGFGIGKNRMVNHFEN